MVEVDDAITVIHSVYSLQRAQRSDIQYLYVKPTCMQSHFTLSPQLLPYTATKKS